MATPPLIPNVLINGDVDYVAELNANFASLSAAMVTVQGQLKNLPAVQSIQLFLQAVLGSTNTFLGVDGLDASIDGPIVTITAGFIWVAQSSNVLQLIAETSQDMTGFLPGSWFICMDSAGNVGVFNSSADGTAALYSFTWTGTTITFLTALCPRAGLASL